MDFRQSAFMYALAFGLVLFVIGQSMFFLVKAWKRGRELGIETATLRNTVTSSVLFTIAPSIALATTVVVLSNAFGIVLPWIRMNLIGSFTYEVTAATAAVDGLGVAGGLGAPITDPAVFSAVAWVMTIGSVFPLILLPIVLKRVQARIGKVVNKPQNAAWTDLLAAAAFIGLIAAFVARALAGGSDEAARAGDGAGVLSVIALATAIIVMLLLELLAEKREWKWAQPFTMPLSMFTAMGAAILFAQILPEHIAFLEWR